MPILEEYKNNSIPLKQVNLNALELPSHPKRIFISCVKGCFQAFNPHYQCRLVKKILVQLCISLKLCGIAIALKPLRRHKKHKIKV